ncbi:branched-chain amino acid ABC transporter substrate-binding protein [Hypericibacter terrae]|jgi:branched-chain amino acid transport system substrate-binding protein|uniref:Branched-chain amino acid ABC transporter substrate-binding protein n=1 Tax=Hypericibacter terrae TaxID=2602015 RepID=A0A5J6MTG2_9PROT|nr:ABC transporter substrate-binding protein [Hypericibacter terrae]QEX18166.1 branched-chain amino acid ABC transporter substrate-binding protein [Hypericibacter terrae]
MGLKLFGTAAALGLAASLLATGATRADEKPIIIGAAIALSGDIAPYDDGPAKGMELAIADINKNGGLLGRQIKIIYSDTKSDIAYGSTAAQDVIDKGADMVVVTCDYDYGGAAATVADSKNLIAFSTCAGDPKFGPSGIGPNAFTMATGSPGQAALMAEWAYQKKGWKTAYVLLDTSIAFDATWAATFQKRWIELAGKDNFLGQDTFGGEDTSIASQITRIKGLAKQPDLIVICSFPPQGPSAIRQLRAAGLNQPLIGSESWDGDFWLEAVPDLSNMYIVTYGSIFGTDPRPEAQAFFKAFQDKFGARPVTSHAMTGYGVIQAWSKAVTDAGTLDTDKVREQLQSFKDVPTLVGPTTYTKDVHINLQRDMIVLGIQNGKHGNSEGVFRAQEVPQ